MGYVKWVALVGVYGPFCELGILQAVGFGLTESSG